MCYSFRKKKYCCFCNRWLLQWFFGKSIRFVSSWASIWSILDSIANIALIGLALRMVKCVSLWAHCVWPSDNTIDDRLNTLTRTMCILSDFFRVSLFQRNKLIFSGFGICLLMWWLLRVLCSFMWIEILNNSLCMPLSMFDSITSYGSNHQSWLSAFIKLLVWFKTP